MFMQNVCMSPLFYLPCEKLKKDKMEKEKIQIEYSLKHVSKQSLWNCLSSSGGLAEWFADEVSDKGSLFTFSWGSNSATAEVLVMTPLSCIRFRWTEDDDDSFFEFRMHRLELTGDWLLEVTDFCEPDEKEAATILWNAQVKALMQRLGL
jgi:uncharacterized protein YndB with AHSA1/START domain